MTRTGIFIFVIFKLEEALRWHFQTNNYREEVTGQSIRRPSATIRLRSASELEESIIRGVDALRFGRPSLICRCSDCGAVVPKCLVKPRSTKMIPWMLKNSSKLGQDAERISEASLDRFVVWLQLRKEKDMLRESQSQSFGLIRKLEDHVRSLSEAHAEDKKYIQKLERELSNCSQEIDYLQDQLNSRNEEVHSLEERVRILELKLIDMDNLEEKVDILREELRRSDMERELLVQELETTEAELQSSSLSVEKLEESISSVALESHCEIESMKLDLMALEQNYFEAKKVQEETLQENERLNSLIDGLEVRIEDAQGIIDNLEKENKEPRETIDLFEPNARVLCQRIGECIEELQNDDRESKIDIQLLMSKVGLSKEMGEIFGHLIAKLSTLHAPDPVLKEKMEKMSLEMQEYEELVKQLKGELRDEKFKAKEEAEDLAQEMAELRYEMTCLLEEERKRRASIEQASLQRITELEAQICGLIILCI
ncbi:trichohyalin-like isoform X3 [Punica granatum]|uniref:Trichohyalin-like isoform X3 n=1 Tax=Punica granatum TaxID=22663 RepID=A0A6P8ED84_PUNGR|nr:trichohyalin-like isoform X3 [Punica granatum]